MPFTASPETEAQLFRHLFEESSLGIAMEDLDGRLLHANPALCSMLGYSAEELCTMSCTKFDSEDELALFQKLRAGLMDSYSLEKCYVRKDGAQIWGSLNVGLVSNGDGGAPVVLAFVEDITKRKLADEALSGVARKLIEAHEQECARIGRELHDDICQRLVLLAVELQQMKQTPWEPAVQVSSRMEELWKQVSEMLNDVQALSNGLRSAKLEYLGVVAAMRGFCEEFAKRQRIEVEFRSHDLPNPLPSPEVSTSLFRVLQEALRNAAKHSGVRHFEVRLWGTTDEFHLTVCDAGAGFDPETALKSRGFGLTNMKERLHLLNGELTIESQLQRGTMIHARVPLSSGHNFNSAAG